MKIRKFWLLVILGLMSCLSACQKPPVPKANSISACFTPGLQCSQEVINSINLAQHNILIQVNALTSSEIAKALVAAKQRQVDINILLDKYQLKQKNYALLKYLINENIPIWIDYKPSVANNKILIIDNDRVITGSYNFAQNNQEKNAANLLIIEDPTLAKSYAVNWQSRQINSIPLAQYLNNNNGKTKITPKKNVQSKGSIALR